MASIDWTNIEAAIDWEELPLSAPSTLYDVLEVSPIASLEIIKRAYYILAHRYHPDKHPPERHAWAEEHMKMLNHAYNVLSDPAKRAEYDTMGKR